MVEAGASRALAEMLACGAGDPAELVLVDGGVCDVRVGLLVLDAAASGRLLSRQPGAVQDSWRRDTMSMSCTGTHCAVGIPD